MVKSYEYWSKLYDERFSKMTKPKKRGRKPGVKVGPYKMSLTEMWKEIKELRVKVAKLEKVIS